MLSLLWWLFIDCESIKRSEAGWVVTYSCTWTLLFKCFVVLDFLEKMEAFGGQSI